MSDDDDTCTEAYRDCVSARSERIERAIADTRGGSDRDIAEVAGVSHTAVINHRRKMGNRFPTKNTVQLKDLIPADFDFWAHPTLWTIEKAMERCSRAELAFLFVRTFPVFERALKERTTRDDRNERIKLLIGDDAAEEDPPTHDAG